MSPGLILAVAVFTLIFRGGAQALPQVTVERHQPSEIKTAIIGASPTQRRVLTEILAGVDPDHVEKIVIAPIDDNDSWAPYSDGGVSIALTGPDTREATWERTLVAGAFADRSKDEGLPPVWRWGEDGHAFGAGGPSDLGGPTPSRVRSLRVLAKDVAAGAARAGAEVEEIRVLRPWGDALAVKLRVVDPAPFLAKRLDRYFDGRWRYERFSDGDLLQVVGPDDEVIYDTSTTRRLSTFGTWIPWRLQGCHETAMPRPSNYGVPPCPLD